MVKGDVSAEVTALDTEGMLAQGREYAKIAPNVVVKCPLTLDGLKATRTLTDEGIGVNVTLCFSAAQAILAAKAGATARATASNGTCIAVLSFMTYLL